MFIFGGLVIYHCPLYQEASRWLWAQWTGWLLSVQWGYHRQKMPLPPPRPARLVTITPGHYHLQEQPRLARPLSCLPLHTGPFSQVGFFQAAHQFHILVDTQRAPKQQHRLTSPDLPSSFLTPCWAPTIGKESSMALFPCCFRESSGVGPLTLPVH